MRKILIVVVVLLCLLVLPVGLGMHIEGMFRRQLDSLDQSSVYAMEVEAYERGWFTSTADVAIAVDSEYLRNMSVLGDTTREVAASPEDGVLHVVTDIDHGPLRLDDGFFAGMARMSAELDDSSAAVAELRNRLAMPYLIRLRGRVGFLGGFSFVADVPPIDYADDTGEFEFSGALIEGSYQGRHLDATGRVESFSLLAQAGTATVEGIRFATQTDFISEYLGIGDGELVIDSIVIGDAFGGPVPVLTAEDLKLTAAAGLDDTQQLLSAAFVYSAASISTGTQELDFSDLELGLRFANLHVDSLNAYYDAMLRSDTMSQDALAAIIWPLAEAALERAPTFAVDPIAFNLSGEPFDARIEVGVDSDAIAGADLGDPTLLPTVLRASANATASKSLAARIAVEALRVQLAAATSGQPLPPGQDIESMAQAQAQLMLATLLAQGILVDAGESYRMTLEYGGGELVVNGNPMPLEMF